MRGRDLRRLLPAVVVLAIVTLVPLARTIWTSLHRSTPADNAFVGVRNFTDLVANSDWWLAVATSLVIVTVVVVLQVFLGVLLGAAIHRTTVMWPLSRVIVLLPFVLLSVVNVLMWRDAVDGGYLAQWFGLGEAGHPTQFVAMVIAETWRGTGLVAAVVALALAAVPRPLLEAATADGATGRQRWRRVVLPSIGPTLAAVAAFRVFDTYRVIDGPLLVDDPSADLTTAPLLTWTTQFTSFELGLGAAMSLVVLVVAALIAGIILPLFRVRRIV